MTRPPFTGPMPTLWDGDGIDAAFNASERLLTAVQPDAVQLHTWNPRPVLSRLGRALPRVQWVMGVGVDTIARRVALGEWSPQRGVAEFVSVARVAHDLGAAAIMWNAEAGWKREPTGVERSRLEATVRAALAEVRLKFPSLRQWHTAYDHPTYHGSYPWSAWLGRGSPIEASFPQVYAAPASPDLIAHRGALPAREARALASWRSAVRAGMIRDDAPNTSPDDLEDVDWRPYYQLHHVTAADTVASALRHELVALWALRSRSDGEGRRAFAALVALHRLGYWGEGALARFQGDHGLVADGIYGPRTEAALLPLANVDPAVLP